MQGNYRTAQPTGLGHLPTLLARLAIPRGWTDPFSEPLRPVECAHIGTSSKNFRLGTGDWAGGFRLPSRLHELLPSGYLACDSARGYQGGCCTMLGGWVFARHQVNLGPDTDDRSNPPANFPQLSPLLISSSQLTKTTTMGTIVDLPLEVFELIIAEFLTESIESYSSVTDCVGSGNRMVKNLRLVCRKWADWIYVHHLYREMIFADIDRTAHFIRHITNRPKHLPRAEIKYLRLFCIWTRGPRPFLHDHEDDCESYTCRSPRLWISAQMVEALIELFSDTILKLELLFWNVLSLPERTLEVIGSIKNLHTLQVGHEKCYEECGQADRQTPTSSSFDKGEHYEEFEEQLQKHYQHPGIEQEFENDYIYDDDIFPYHRHHYPDMQVLSSLPTIGHW
ncbi:hypothetical protein KEM48_008445 [Puccinia striiformis f. sp. tritici PST-130]|nr:hypothetical protein KEM48_008445 [Puccinia striiformis f. sp. tritici PST-130]